MYDLKGKSSNPGAHRGKETAIPEKGGIGRPKMTKEEKQSLKAIDFRREDPLVLESWKKVGIREGGVTSKKKTMVWREVLGIKGKRGSRLMRKGKGILDTCPGQEAGGKGGTVGWGNFYP